ncbi:MAG: rhodanese-like domain-containing protein [Flavobacteriales bacterium]|nr:rhodanese-like domain-containing protein [Flavobacteriales bacterium]
MQTRVLILFLLVSVFHSACFNRSDNGEPWTDEQLMDPVSLSEILNDQDAQLPFIYSIGPSGLIKNSMDIGEGKSLENIEKLGKELGQLSKDADIIIYCGCCPFKDCPNIRPAFDLLNEMEFTNHKLLNLPQNLKVDWIDKGYPMNEQ